MKKYMKTKKIDVICQYCSKEFKVVPSLIKIGKGKYCSKKCYINFMKKYPNKGVYKKGHITKTEIKNKISESKLKNPTKYWQNKKHSIETKKKISSKLWKGGAQESNKRNYIKNKKYNQIYKKKNNERDRQRRYTDIKYNLNHRMSCAIWATLKSNKNGKRWEILVGYTTKNLMKHLKSTMPLHYNWQDYLDGKLQIDHIIPISVFNYTQPENTDFKRCWALKNLRLLPARENIKKGSKLSKPFQPALEI